MDYYKYKINFNYPTFGILLMSNVKIKNEIRDIILNIDDQCRLKVFDNLIWLNDYSAYIPFYDYNKDIKVSDRYYETSINFSRVDRAFIDILYHEGIRHNENDKLHIYGISTNYLRTMSEMSGLAYGSG